MVWRAQIRPASFRGVSFGVSGDDKESGRRTVLHEFPQREEAFVEDMGAATTRFSVQAFVLGPDYMSQRDALEKALCEPGPGTLVHPWYGEITVSQCAPYKVKHSAQDGGMAVFTISFARDGEPSSPSSGINSRVRGRDKSGLAGRCACTAFDAAFLLEGQTAYVVEQAYQAVDDALIYVEEMLDIGFSQGAYLLGIDSGYGFLLMASVGMSLWSAFQGIGASSGKSSARLAGDWQRVAAGHRETPCAQRPGSMRARIAGNTAAVNAFVRQIAVVESAGHMAAAAPESRGQARELREGFMDALDAVLMDAAPMPDTLYTALVETRAATLAALAEAARQAPDVITYTSLVSRPVLALCHHLTGHIALEADFIVRNGIIHPGFVPVEALEVLTYE